MVAPRSGEPKERIFVAELAQYLNHRSSVLRKFARKRGLLHKTSLGSGRTPLDWVTPYGASRVIAYIRALQGDKYLQGRDYHRECERQRAYDAEKRAKRKAAQTFSLAFSEAGAEAEPSGAGQRLTAPGESGIAETPGCHPYLGHLGVGGA